MFSFPRFRRGRRNRSHTFEAGRRESTYPAPYPGGWYAVADSGDIGKDPLAVDCLGKNFVAFRGASGKPVLLDAHCPHQGASLAGGKVCGDQIECPFHHWRFSAEGSLAAIPGLDKLPRVGVRSYPVRERYGALWTYHDVSGDPVEPPYELQSVEDVDDGRLIYRGQHAPPDVRMHLAEFAENSVDFQHFAVLHGDLTIPWTQVKIPGLGIRHEPDWEVDAERPWVTTFSDFACVTVRGTAYPKSGAHARITMYGPGGSVWFRFSLPDLGDIVLFQWHLPLQTLRQRVRFRWYADPKIPRPLVWWVVGHWMSQWNADIEIWENKVFRQRPVLVSLDGPVHRMRRWYEQFYATARPAHPPSENPNGLLTLKKRASS